MTVSDLKISQLVDLLGRSMADEKLVAALGPHLFQVDRSAFRGSISLPGEGLDFMFDGPKDETRAPAGAICLCAIHLTAGAQAGSHGELPSGVAIGDTEAQVRDKLGEPMSTGGGGFTSPPFNWPIPYWLKYQIGKAIFHFQLDDAGRVNMVTLMLQGPQSAGAPREKLVIVITPSLVSTLWRREKENGAPLTEQEVLAIRDGATAIAVPAESAAADEETRGYRDLDPGNCRAEWQQARLELIEHEKGKT